MDFIPFKKRNLSDEVKKYLFDYIKSMDLTKSTKLPPEDIIAQNLSVSRVTVRKALTDLEQEGIVFRIHGKGTFANVEASQIKVNINYGLEFEQLIIDSGYNAQVKIMNLELIRADQTMSEKLQIQLNDPVIRIDKIFYADGNPAIFCMNIIPEHMISDISAEEYNNYSIFEILRRKAGKIITWDKVEMHVSSKEKCSSQNNSINLMNNESLLVFETTNFDQDNNPVLFALEVYDTDFIKFNIIRQKNIKYTE